MSPLSFIRSAGPSPFPGLGARMPHRTKSVGAPMSLLQFSQLAEIVGVIAVIGSLVYVGMQLKQNTTALHAQSRQSVLTASQDELFKVVDRPDLTLAIAEGRKLTPLESVALNNWYTAGMRARMYAWLQYQDRIIDQDQWNEERLVIQVVYSTGRGRCWWQKVGRQMFTAPFVDMVDDALRDLPVSDRLYKSMVSWPEDERVSAEVPSGEV